MMMGLAIINQVEIEHIKIWSNTANNCSQHKCFHRRPRLRLRLRKHLLQILSTNVACWKVRNKHGEP